MTTKLKVVKVEGAASRALDIKMDELIKQRKDKLKKLGAKSYESVYVKGGKARSLQHG